TVTQLAYAFGGSNPSLPTFYSSERQPSYKSVLSRVVTAIYLFFIESIKLQLLSPEGVLNQPCGMYVGAFFVLN
ncbi:hypothetical protein, partial [Porphyromonas sp.]|uniref:hypothetical protein n=1 Tax=Porphyromonas sp. TaxID=1924944 RepID=UPI0026DC8CC6